MNRDIKDRINLNARIPRFISRAEMFERNRKSKEELDYLKYYDAETRQQIVESMNGSIPSPLPPLGVTTISYYRRSNSGIYQTRPTSMLEPENHAKNNIDPHMVYESLWILAGIDDKSYDNYLLVVRQFERQLGLYLASQSNDIREMAMIAAGNKIIGKETDILNIIQADLKQLWILINHIYQHKISLNTIFKFVQPIQLQSTNQPDNTSNQQILKTLYEMTNNKDDQSIEAIVENQQILGLIVNSLNSSTCNNTLKKYSLRIIGNILAEREEYVHLMYHYKLLDHLFLLLNSNDLELRKDTCWVVSNYAFQKNTATQVVRNGKIMEKLTQMLYYEQSTDMKIELMHVFSHVAEFGEKLQVFKLLGNEETLNICYKYLQLEDVELNLVTLFFMKELIKLGNSFANEEEGNAFCNAINREHTELKNQVLKKSYSDNVDISQFSIDILGELDQDY